MKRALLRCTRELVEDLQLYFPAFINEVLDPLSVNEDWTKTYVVFHLEGDELPDFCTEEETPINVTIIRDQSSLWNYSYKFIKG